MAENIACLRCFCLIFGIFITVYGAILAIWYYMDTDALTSHPTEENPNCTTSTISNIAKKANAPKTTSKTTPKNKVTNKTSTKPTNKTSTKPTNKPAPKPTQKSTPKPPRGRMGSLQITPRAWGIYPYQQRPRHRHTYGPHRPHSTRWPHVITAGPWGINPYEQRPRHRHAFFPRPSRYWGQAWKEEDDEDEEIVLEPRQQKAPKGPNAPKDQHAPKGKDPNAPKGKDQHAPKDPNAPKGKDPNTPKDPHAPKGKGPNTPKDPHAPKGNGTNTPKGPYPPEVQDSPKRQNVPKGKGPGTSKPPNKGTGGPLDFDWGGLWQDVQKLPKDIVTRIKRRRRRRGPKKPRGCFAQGQRHLVFGLGYMLLGTLLLVSAYEKVPWAMYLFLWLFTSSLIVHTVISGAMAMKDMDCAASREMLFAGVFFVVGIIIIVVVVIYNQAVEKQYTKNQTRIYLKYNKQAL